MCEPLRGKKKVVDTKHYQPIPRGQTIVDIFLKEDVKSAVEFYKKYRNNPDELFEDFNLIDKMKDYGIPEVLSPEDMEDYNDWLFDYCFGDVI